MVKTALYQKGASDNGSNTPRKNKSGEIISYTIRVYRGYDSAGNRLKPYTMTWKPESGMTPKQAEKELNRQAVQFEEQCRNGGAANPTSQRGNNVFLNLALVESACCGRKAGFHDFKVSRAEIG